MEAFRTTRPDPDDALDLDTFEAGLRGSIVFPGSPAYDEARQVHNASVDKRSQVLIVQAANAGDVARTIVFARETGLELAVRGGSHSLAGHGTIRGWHRPRPRRHEGPAHIDPERRLAWAQPGLFAPRVHERSPRPPTGWPPRSATPAASASPG